MSEEAVLISIDDRGVATITLNRPDKHNAFNDQIVSQLNRALIAVEENPAVRVVVLAAHGKSFSAGADVGWMQRMVDYGYEENLADASELARMLYKLNRLPKPVIAKVHGAAFGGGIGLISCSDIAIASEMAFFCLSEVKVGLIPATISPYVIAAIGERASRHYFITAERFSAAAALNLGLVSEIVAPDKLDAAIERTIDSILENGPQAIAAAKKLVLDVSGKVINDVLKEDTSERIAQIRISGEAQEGLMAFIEKRKPKWLP